MTVTVRSITAPSVDGTSPYTVAKPSGVTTGDLLIASVVVTSNAIDQVLPPEGWFAALGGGINGDDNISAWYRVVGASEPASYDFSSIVDANTGVGLIALYSSTGAALRIEDVASQVNASGDRACPNVTFTAAGVYVGLIACGSSLSSTPPMGATEQWDVTLSGNRSGCVTGTVSGAGTVSLTATGSSAISKCIALAVIEASTTYAGIRFRSQTNTGPTNVTGTIGVTMASDIESGDMLVAHLSLQSDRTVTTPAGWTLQANLATTGGMRVYTRPATGADAGDTLSIAFAGATVAGSLAVSAWWSLDGDELVIGDVAMASTGATASITFLSVTSERDGAALVLLTTKAQTTQYDLSSDIDLWKRYDYGGTSVRTSMFSEYLLAIGATGSRSAEPTSGAHAADMVSLLIEVAPDEPIRNDPPSRLWDPSQIGYGVAISSGGNDVRLPSDVVVIPLWYEWIAEGGPSAAEIELQGVLGSLWMFLQLLAKRVTILNKDGVGVWWGYLNEVSISLAGGLRVGLSLENMANRVAIRYQVQDETGVVLREVTTWSENEASILAYGTKERLERVEAQIGADLAAARRNALLSDLGLPLPLYENGDDRGIVGNLRCKGYIESLDWVHYAQVDGLEANDYDTTGAKGGALQHLGQGLTDDTFGFVQGRISDLDGRLDALVRGHSLAVSGSGSNDGTYLITTVGQRAGTSYTATTISFDPTDDIHDSAEELNFLDRDDYIVVSGSASNDDIYRVKSVSGEQITVSPSTVVLEAAGASVTIARGNTVEVDDPLVTEAPGATVTLRVVGSKVTHAFTIAAGSWTVAAVQIRVKKVGAPSDALTLDLCADSAGDPGTILDAQTVNASDINLFVDWVTFTLSNTDTISTGANYHLVLKRTGANHIDNYYVVEIDEDLRYAGGAMRLWDGTAWVARAPAGDLLFRVRGARESSDQITDIVDVCGQFLAGADIIDSSGVDAWQYRQGLTTGKTELLGLLRSGSSNGRRLLATVTQDLYLRVYEQPNRETVEVLTLLTADQRLINRLGSPLVHGRLCAGEWIDLAEVPPTVGYANRLMPVFVERAVMNCRDDLVTVVPAAMDAAYNVGRILRAE